MSYIVLLQFKKKEKQNKSRDQKQMLLCENLHTAIVYAIIIKDKVKFVFPLLIIINNCVNMLCNITTCYVYIL